MLGMIKLGLHKAQGQSDVAESEYTKRLIQLSTLKSEHETLRVKLNGQELSEQEETDRARFDYLDSRLPAREQQVLQMDLKYERTQLATLKNLFSSVSAEYRTYRNEGWDSPEAMIGRFSWAGGAISEMYGRCKILLYDVHYLTCSFKSQGQHVDELDPKASDVVKLKAKSQATEDQIDDVIESDGLKDKVKSHLSAMQDTLEMEY